MATASTDPATAEDVREFTIDVPEEQLEDLRHRINATRWPDREVDPSQGVRLETIQALAALLGDGLRLARVRAALRRAAALRHRDRRGRHPLHPRPLRARGRAAAHRHARMAGLDGRAAQDHRPAHRSHRARRERGGRLPSRDPVPAGPRVLGQADRDRLGSRPHRAGLGHADGPPRLHGVRRAGRRLGQRRHRAAGAAQAAGPAGHPHEHAGDRPPRRVAGARRSATRRRRASSAEEQKAYDILVHFFATGIGYAGEMANRPQTLYGIADSPVGLAAWMLDHDVAQLRAHRARLRRRARRPLARRRARQRHPLLADEHGDLLGASLLGEQAGLLRRQGRRAPGRRDRLPRRALSRPAELGGAGLSQARPLQRGRRGRPLRRLGAAADLLARRCARPSGRCVDRAAGLSIEGRLPDLDGATALAQLRTADPGGPAREGRRRPVLHLLVRQLAAHPALRQRLGRASTATTAWS